MIEPSNPRISLLCLESQHDLVESTLAVKYTELSMNPCLAPQQAMGAGASH